ncbi:hypothetical protein ACFQZS_14000 [Mucilaginibacter calamicampi]|uniref:Uncharacterized protein n=1 Tax=Mucilaginibacter calamicampi TaxID=1302352 RepID=A0ABW2YZQ7_9SPHI
MQNAEQTIPQQKTGRATDFTADREFDDRQSAHKAFKQAASRLLTINQWQQYAGAGSSKFCLTNNEGQELNGFAKEGLLISIDLPVPGSNAGDGLEWVTIERIEVIEDAKADEEFISITVRPVPDPHKTDTQIAHFYKDLTTNTFIVKRSHNKVIAGAHGRNETPNNEDVDLHDKVRNTIVALTARIGLAGPQWKMLVNGLLDGED